MLIITSYIPRNANLPQNTSKAVPISQAPVLRNWNLVSRDCFKMPLRQASKASKEGRHFLFDRGPHFRDYIRAKR